METKIKGIKITYNEKNLVFYDSYKIHNIDKMKDIVNKALLKSGAIYYPKRKPESFINEWIAHNNLYSLHLFRKHTSSADFEVKIKKPIAFIYFILSRPNKIKYYILKRFNKNKILKKQKEYTKYIEEHINNVQKAYEEMKECPFINQLNDSELLLEKLKLRALAHDGSKYWEDEFEPYRKHFYPINEKEKEEYEDDFEQAWTLHWQRNSHHWQHRQNKTSFDKNDMEQVLDVLENVLDWIAMGYKFNDRPYQYYENNKDNIILCDEERAFLEDVIYKGIDANRGM